MDDSWRSNPERRCAGLERIYTSDLGVEIEPWRLQFHCASGGGCPVIWECLEDALSSSPPDKHTVRGATTPRQRARHLRLGGGVDDALICEVRRLIAAGGMPATRRSGRRRRGDDLTL
jgi:hypothetical protein